MNKRIKKKKAKQAEQKNAFCDSCGRYTEYWREENEGEKLCPSCWANYVGISASEVWSTLI